MNGINRYRRAEVPCSDSNFAVQRVRQIAHNKFGQSLFHQLIAKSDNSI